MRAQRCIAPPQEDGDCWRACIATILNLHASEVPNFVNGLGYGADYAIPTREWLEQRGLGLFETHYSAEWSLGDLLKWRSGNSPNVPMIICGASERKPIDNHAVVAMNGKVVHDPSNSGLSGPCIHESGGERYWWLYVIAFAAHSNLTNLQPEAARP